MLQVSKQNVITVSGEVEIDLLELIQNRSDFLFGTISSKEGKKKKKKRNHNSPPTPG